MEKNKKKSLKNNLKKNKAKKIIVMIVLATLVLGIIILISVYLGNNNFRMWTDKNILKKDIQESSLPAIDLTTNDNTKIYAYGNYVAALENNDLSIYNKDAKKVTNLNISISKPLFSSEGDYLLIADEGASKLYLVYNESLQWEKDIDGQISKVTVNSNGEVGIIVTGTTYKSVIIMYNLSGKENFKIFLSTTNAIDLALSEDGKKLSFIEINTSGATISSKIKVVSVDKAVVTPSESITNTYELPSDVLLIKIKFKKNRVVALADDGVRVYNDGKEDKLLNIDSNISFIDINLDGHVASIKEEANKFELNLTNVENSKQNTYLINDTVKKIYCSGSITAIDVGNRVEFVSNRGWLIKKFTSNQNIKNIIIGKNVATIIYKDRAEIISL